ncbi:hypothetical protein [Telluria aromaticivorans]|uniref:Uncharacterized protein n=1 Tax=Telluria aromaticivorans TaxID=2725995 RepID=A0A7Y2JZW9_9BURK|nr:hypothetical protein [Telluria aromaticivorans]NNG23560.1 hypothetical protein [Telluria aromaticivorans]
MRLKRLSIEKQAFILALRDVPVDLNHIKSVPIQSFTVDFGQHGARIGGLQFDWRAHCLATAA